MKKKILFMLYFMKCGGVEKALLNLLTLLDGNQYDVTVLLAGRKGEYLRYIPDWVNVDEVAIPEDETEVFFNGARRAIVKYTLQGRISEAFKKLIRAWKISRLPTGWEKSAAYFESISPKLPVLNVQYDLAVDFHGYTSFTTFYVAEKVKAAKKASWIHSELGQSDPRPFYKYYKKYDNIFCVSQKCMEEFAGFFPEFRDKTSLFYNIVPADLIIAMSALGKGFGDDFNGTRMLTVGRLSAAKGYDMAIPVFARLKKEGYDVRWYAVGEGEERGNIEKLIKRYDAADGFILLGFASNPYPYMKQCDIYVQPSRYEGNPISVAEARIFNKPIVCTDFSGSREQLIDGETGLIADFDENSIHDAVQKLLEDASLRRSFSDNLSKQMTDTSQEIEKLYALLEDR